MRRIPCVWSSLPPPAAYFRSRGGKTCRHVCCFPNGGKRSFYCLQPSTFTRGGFMRVVKPLLLSFSLLAFAGAYADDAKDKSADQSKPSTSQSQTGGAGGAASSSGGTATSPGAAAGGTSSSSSAKSGDAEFDKLDKNHDGMISREEGKAGHASGAAGASSDKSSGGTSGRSMG